MRVSHKEKTLKSSDGVAFPSKPSASGRPGVPCLFLGHPLLAAPSRPSPCESATLASVALQSSCPWKLCYAQRVLTWRFRLHRKELPAVRGLACLVRYYRPSAWLRGGPMLLVERTRPRRSGVDDRMSRGRGGWGPVRAEGARPLDVHTGQTWSRTKARGRREAWERLCLRVVPV